MPETTSAAKFALGQVVGTRGALAELDAAGILEALGRHATGDWGDLCPEDRQVNEDALRHGHRLFSVYYSSHGTKFYVITEWDRSITTVLLPDEY